MKTEKPMHGSGKTRFNREKKKGESWIKLKDEAVKKGTFQEVKKLSILSR